MNFICKRCARCCGNFLPISEREKRELQLLIKKNKLKPTWNNMCDNPYYVCPFLKGNSCLIYDKRPTICWEYSCYNMKHSIYPEALAKEKLILTDLRSELW